MRRLVFGGLGLEQLVGILVQSFEDMAGGNSRVLDRGQRRQRNGMPLGLGSENLLRIISIGFHLGNTWAVASCDSLTSAARGFTGPFLRASFLSCLTVMRFLSGGGREGPSFVSEWVRFFPIWSKRA